jgi:hypothetical protein
MQVLIGLSLPSFGETMMTIQSDRKDGMWEENKWERVRF